MSQLIIAFWMSCTLVCEYSFVDNTPASIFREQVIPSYLANSDSLNKYEFVKEQVFGDTEEILLGMIGDIEVDSKDQVYIVDMGNNNIQVFSPDGSYSGSISRQGRGPGEFANATRFTQIIIQSNKIYVTGTEWVTSDKVHVFSLDDFSLIDEILFDSSEKKEFNSDLENYFPRSVYPFVNEQMLVGYEHHRSSAYIKREQNHIPYYLHDSNGSLIEGPVLVQKDRTYLYQVHEGRQINYYAFPFFGKSLLEVSNDGVIYTAFTDEFNINVQSPNGETLRTIEHPFQKIPITRSGLISKYEEIDMSRLDFYEGDDTALKMIREADNLPQAWPALDDMIIDDENRLWVSTIVEDFDIYEWWVLEENGELITKFEWPRDEPIEVIKNGKVYARQTDEITGLQQVVRYGIELVEI